MTADSGPPSLDSVGELLRAARPPAADRVAQLLQGKLRKALLGREGAPPTLGRFEIRGVLGSGGMGVVYDAWDPRLERRVALKAIPEASSEEAKLLAEARALAQLSHPNVVAVYEAEAHGDEVLIAMERVDGSNLRRHLAKQPSAWRAVLEVVLDAGRGLAAVHAAGLVHRDVKPENILVGSDGRSRIGDFGLARSFSATVAAGSGNGPAGTAGYVAPEVRGGQPADQRSDQYSLALTASEALGGDAELVAPRAPRRVREILARGLRSDPVERFDSVSELVLAIERAVRGSPWRRGLAIAVAVSAAAAFATWHFAARPAAGSVCLDSLGAPPSSWSEARKAEIREAFARTGSPIAADAAQRTIARLEVVHDAMAAHARRACAQPDDVNPARDACLRRSSRRFDLFMRVLLDADETFVAKAPGVVPSVAELEECLADAEVGDAKLPADVPKIRVQRELAEAALDESEILLETAGRAGQALEATQRGLALARSADDGRLIARALYRLGIAQRASESFEAGDRSLRAALEVAEAAGADDIAARAWIRLGSSATLKDDLDRAREHHRQARAKIQRLGDPAELLAFWHHAGSSLDSAARDYDGARRSLEEALRLYEPLGLERPRIVSVLSELAKICDLLGERDLAHQHAVRALEIGERIYGPDNPNVIKVIHELAWSALRRSDARSAERLLRRALAILDASIEKRPLLRADVLSSLAAVHDSLGQANEARQVMEEVLRARELAWGSDSPKLRSNLINLARTTMAKEPERAEEQLERAYRMSLKVGDRAIEASASYHLGLCRQAQSDVPGAIAHFRVALGVYGELYGPGHPKSQMVATALAEALLELGRPDEAAGLLEPRADDKRSPFDRAYTQFVHARALWSVGARKRALSLGRTALAELDTLEGDPARKLADQVQQWLADNR